MHRIFGLNALLAEEFATAVEHLQQADHANNMMVRYHLALAEAELGNTDEANRLFAEIAVYNFNSINFALIGRDAAGRVNQ